VKAENIVSKGIKNQNLKGASLLHLQQFPETGIMFGDRYCGIKNLCKMIGLAE
jgi:hypothetical protein